MLNSSNSDIMEYSLTAFEKWRNAKFLFRVWLNDHPNEAICNVPLWISFNETTGNFSVDISKVTSIGQVSLKFQSQLIGYSFLNYLLNNTISTYIANFYFLNENWILISSIYSDWYVVINQIANFTLKFNDKENDKVSMILVNSGACNAFIQAQSTSSFNLKVMCDDNSVSETAITLKYTDKYHQDSQYWVKVDINLNIFKSQPPLFSSKLSPIQINLWDSSQLTFRLPDIIDTDSSLFKVSLESSAPAWIHVIASTSEFQSSSDNFYVSYSWLH